VDQIASLSVWSSTLYITEDHRYTVKFLATLCLHVQYEFQGLTVNHWHRCFPFNNQYTHTRTRVIV